MRALQRPEIMAAIVLLTVAAPVGLLAWLMKAVVFPLLIASVLYVLLEPLVHRLRRQGINRTLAISLVLTLVVGVLVWFVVAMVPLLLDQIAAFRTRLPQVWENISRLMAQVEAWTQTTIGISVAGAELVPSATTVQKYATRLVGGASGVLADAALWLILIPLIAFFLLRDFRGLRNQVMGFFPNHRFEEALIIYHKVADQLGTYVRSVMLQSVIMAVITSIGFTIVGLPMALLLGTLAGIFNLIPYLGPLLGLVPPVLVALSMSADPQLLFATVAVVAIAQLNDNIVVVPALLARAANLHPLVALLAVIVAGNLFGLAGMVFALPVLASMRIIYVGVLDELRRAARGRMWGRR